MKPKTPSPESQQPHSTDRKADTKDVTLFGFAFLLCILTTLLMLALSGNALQFDAVYRGF